MGIQTMSKVKIYEKDGEELRCLESEYMEISNTWNRHNMVDVRIGKTCVAVSGYDLIKAIESAIRAGDC